MSAASSASERSVGSSGSDARCTASSAASGPHASPSSSKGKGGRKAANPHLSDDERRRERVLKNRESAMKSLQKKKRYTEGLEARAHALSTRNTDLKNKIRRLLDRIPPTPAAHEYLASLPPLPPDLLPALPQSTQHALLMHHAPPPPPSAPPQHFPHPHPQSHLHTHPPPPPPPPPSLHLPHTLSHTPPHGTHPQSAPTAAHLTQHHSSHHAVPHIGSAPPPPSAPLPTYHHSQMSAAGLSGTSSVLGPVTPPQPAHMSARSRRMSTCMTDPPPQTLQQQQPQQQHEPQPQLDVETIALLDEEAEALAGGDSQSPMPAATITDALFVGLPADADLSALLPFGPAPGTSSSQSSMLQPSAGF